MATVSRLRVRQALNHLSFSLIDQARMWKFFLISKCSYSWNMFQKARVSGSTFLYFLFDSMVSFVERILSSWAWKLGIRDLLVKVDLIVISFVMYFFFYSLMQSFSRSNLVDSLRRPIGCLQSDTSCTHEGAAFSIKMIIPLIDQKELSIPIDIGWKLSRSRPSFPVVCRFKTQRDRKRAFF